MGMIEDTRKVLQDVLAPDLKAIHARLDAIEKRIDANHSQVMSSFTQLADVQQVKERLAALETERQVKKIHRIKR